MKRILILAAAVMLAVACTQTSKPKTLVLYYSQTGTTKVVAEAIQTRLGADIAEVVPVAPYDGDYGSTIARGRQEMVDGTYPELQPLTVDVSKYDVVFIGFPIWFGTYANPIETLLNTVDFSGKKVVPFCTFGSGGLDTSSKAIKAKLTDSEVVEGYGVRSARIDAVPAEVERFLVAGGYMEGDCTVPAEFSEVRPASAEEAAIFDAAVGTYPMISATSEQVSSREVPGGMEYLFVARNKTGEGTIKVYVLAETGKDPVFTQVLR